MHWSCVDDPAQAASPAAPEPVPPAEPAVRSPIEQIAELLEALFVKQPDLVTALLEALGRADTATLARLFRSPSVPAESAARRPEFTPWWGKLPCRARADVVEARRRSDVSLGRSTALERRWLSAESEAAQLFPIA